MIVSMILVICLGCLAFWFGNSLYQRLAHEFNSGPPSLPVVGEVISLSSLPTIAGVSTVPLAAGNVISSSVTPTNENDSALNAVTVHNEGLSERGPQTNAHEQL
jgi:hypothetical protein